MNEHKLSGFIQGKKTTQSFPAQADLGSIPTPIQPSNCRRLSASMTASERQQNVQVSLTLLHGMANIITELGHQISTADNQSLTNIAQGFSSGPPHAALALSLLLHDQQITISTRMSRRKNDHANVLQALVMATGQMIDIRNVNSEKNALNGQCVVTFHNGSKIKRWKFKETGQDLSETFLRHACKCIGSTADGQFVIHQHPEDLITFTFLNDHLYAALSPILGA